MFIDQIKVKLVAGKGGNGLIAWRREKYIPKGGPYGGNGGRGGNILLEADESLYSLEPYRNKKILRAQSGQGGGTNLKQGKNGLPLHLKVPFGTLVKDAESGQILHDFTPENPRWTACFGGKGGKGNHFFKSSTNRAPNICTQGKAGEEKKIELELKLIADVGLVGLPNAGKSTLLSTITHAKVKIGAYPFTTLTPNLSYIQSEEYRRILIADIPGIIEKAHQNKGLGFAFLKHIERTSILVFVLDVCPEKETQHPLHDFEILQKELQAYHPEMLSKPFLIALNKCDKEGALEKIADFKKTYPFDPKTVFTISAKLQQGLSPLITSICSLAKTV